MDGEKRLIHPHPHEGCPSPRSGMTSRPVSCILERRAWTKPFPSPLLLFQRLEISAGPGGICRAASDPFQMNTRSWEYPEGQWVPSILAEKVPDELLINGYSVLIKSPSQCPIQARIPSRYSSTLGTSPYSYNYPHQDSCIPINTRVSSWYPSDWCQARLWSWRRPGRETALQIFPG